jgi:uncharacterized protein YggU (UPF0235/DUF167 family)
MKIKAHIHPGAKANKVEKLPGGGLHLYVIAQPTDGKANAAAIKLLAEYLGVKPNKVFLTAGAGSKIKTFEIFTG